MTSPSPNVLQHSQPSPINQKISLHQIRRIILEQSKRAQVGHIGSALSVADIIFTLYVHVLHIPHPQHPDRDRFVLSKGHAALALYAALFLKGWLTERQLSTFCSDGSLLGVHPEHRLPGVDFSTGSLGHGLSIGAGAALAARLQRSSRRVFVLVSDAECNEGSPWEAIVRWEVVNAIFYVLRTGCQWRLLPHDLPPWLLVYAYFRNWRLEGTWQRRHETLRRQGRRAAGRHLEASAAILDSQSVKSTEKGDLGAAIQGTGCGWRGRLRARPFLGAQKKNFLLFRFWRRIVIY